MVATLRGFQRIISYAELVIGQEFASTRTGQHYLKLQEGFVRTKDGRPSDKVEDFKPKDLVYVDGLYDERVR